MTMSVTKTLPKQDSMPADAFEAGMPRKLPRGSCDHGEKHNDEYRD